VDLEFTGNFGAEEGLDCGGSGPLLGAHAGAQEAEAWVWSSPARTDGAAPREDAAFASAGLWLELEASFGCIVDNKPTTREAGKPVSCR